MYYIAKNLNQYLNIMRKILLLLFGIFVTGNLIYAGGLVTNTNQSTAWTRMLARDASVDIDAVFYNPAGLVKLKDGFHISMSSQTIWQTQTIQSAFPFLNDSKYEGKIFAPVFPSVYMAWKKGKMAISLGFKPVGGGGGATFDRGLPSMEIPIAAAAKQFAPMGVTGYSADMYFEGSSIYWGLQLGVSYAITENISVFAGGRYVMAKNTYQGYLRDISFITAAGAAPADDFMIGVADQAAATAGSAGDMMQPLLDNNLGGLTIDQAIGVGALTPEQGAMLKGGLIQFGVDPASVDAMNLGQSQATFYGAQVAYLSPANPLRVGSKLMADQEADVVQKGSGITPILGANLSFMEDKLNIGLKYEFQTNMDLTNETAKDFITGMNPDGTPITMFPDGAKTNADIPAMLSIGVGYKIIEPLTIQIGYHNYFDKVAGWAKTETGTERIDNNFAEYAIGLEWEVSPRFLLSGGYLLAKSGVNELYQSDLSYSLTTNTFGYGFAWKINDVFKLQAGGYFTAYDDETYNKSYSGINYTETYDKYTYSFSVGLDIAIGAK
jgi:long-subunit fatty acid transport protein